MLLILLVYPVPASPHLHQTSFHVASTACGNECVSLYECTMYSITIEGLYELNGAVVCDCDRYKHQKK